MPQLRRGFGRQIAPVIYVDEIRSQNGLGLYNDIGRAIFLKKAGNTIFYQNIQMSSSIDIDDAGGSELIGFDSSGNIDVLAPITGAVTNPAGSQEVTLPPASLVSPNQSGTMPEGIGRWSCAANDSLYLWLDVVFNYLMLLGTVVVENITVFINTTDNADYVNELQFTGTNANDATVGYTDTEPTDIGNGSTGNENGTITCNRTLVAERYHRLRIECVVPNATLIVRAIKIKYKLT